MYEIWYKFLFWKKYSGCFCLSEETAKRNVSIKNKHSLFKRYYYKEVFE